MIRPTTLRSSEGYLLVRLHLIDGSFIDITHPDQAINIKCQIEYVIYIERPSHLDDSIEQGRALIQYTDFEDPLPIGYFIGNRHTVVSTPEIKEAVKATLKIKQHHG